MSQKVSIQEAGKSRNFSGVGVIETETPEGDSCFWVPESERELETEYIIKNGTYRPQKYGFSDIHVNVFDLTTDLDGFKWKIDIGDIDMPDISLPDFDIDLTIDSSTGFPDISVDGVEIDLPDLSGYLDIDAGFDVSLDVDDMGGVSAEISGIDPDGLPVGVDIDLGDLSIDINELPDEIRIMHVPDKTRYKDGEAIELDGIVVQAYRGGEVWEGIDGKYVDGYVPAHELMFDPAFAEKGFVKRVSELIPAGIRGGDSVSYSATGDMKYVDSRGRICATGGYEAFSSYEKGELNALSIYQRNGEYFVLGVSSQFHYGSGKAKVPLSYSSTFNGTYMAFNEDGSPYFPSGDTRYYLQCQSSPIEDSKNSTYLWETSNNYTYNNKKVYYYAYEAYTYVAEPECPLCWNSIGWTRGKIKKQIGGWDANAIDIRQAAWTLLYGDTEDAATVTISWSRPRDGIILSTSFDITVKESDGTHHSGSWDDPSGGHWGGTTTSGNYGGSHSSGKF